MEYTLDILIASDTPININSNYTTQLQYYLNNQLKLIAPLGQFYFSLFNSLKESITKYINDNSIEDINTININTTYNNLDEQLQINMEKLIKNTKSSVYKHTIYA